MAEPVTGGAITEALDGVGELVEGEPDIAGDVDHGIIVPPEAITLVDGLAVIRNEGLAVYGLIEFFGVGFAVKGFIVYMAAGFLVYGL